MKIVVRMLGGLGNQLFQYAYARYLANIYSESEIYLDLREYKTYKVRKFDLDLINLNDFTFKYNKDSELSYDFSRKVFHLYQYLYRKLNKRPLGKGPNFFCNYGLFYSGIEACDKIEIERDIIYLYGYFQDISIVEPIREILLREFSYKSKYSSTVEKYLKDIKSSKNSIAVSIRCAQDYIDSGWPICSIDYYKRGIEILKKQNENYKVFIFADDIKKVKREFKLNEDYIYIEGCNAVESLELLKNCDNFVISNSSFAWWGAYLSENNNKTIIAPTKWFTGLNTKDSPLFLNKEMIILD